MVKGKEHVISDVNQIRIEELSHIISFYFKYDKREFILKINTDINEEGKIELKETDGEMNNYNPILFASDETNNFLFNNLKDKARDILFSICQYADELADEYIE